VGKAGFKARRDDESVDGTDTTSENDGGSIEILANNLAEGFQGSGLIGSSNAAS
jgi:hypothetical protein